MTEIFEGPDAAATPLTPEETRELIPAYIAYRRELNAAEQENIARAQEWALSRRHADIMSEKFVNELHRRMLGDVWRWAGRYRTTLKNIGIDYWLIPVALRQLIGDGKAWIEFQTYPLDEIAVRFHHRLVFIHPFTATAAMRAFSPIFSSCGLEVRVSRGDARDFATTARRGRATSRRCAPPTTTTSARW